LVLVVPVAHHLQQMVPMVLAQVLVLSSLPVVVVERVTVRTGVQVVRVVAVVVLLALKAPGSLGKAQPEVSSQELTRVLAVVVPAL
jgi:hypothetical protein